jgi:hypothetical protein
MKKLVVLISALLFCFSGIARDLGTSWVVTDEGKIECKKVVIGYNHARIVLDNGQKSSIELNRVSSFSMNGKVYTKLPLYKDRKPTNQMVFMEHIKTCGELSLYKYSTFDPGSIDSKENIDQYFLYNGTKLHLALDEKTLPNICKHFGVSYSYAK